MPTCIEAKDETPLSSQRSRLVGNEPCFKKPRCDTVDGMLDSVTAALHSEVAKLDTSHEMLLAMAGGCLRTPAEERHMFQRAVGKMLREMFAEMEKNTEGKIRSAAGEVDSIAIRREALGNDRGIVERKLKDHLAGLKGTETEWCEGNVALKIAKKALAEAKATQAEKDAGVVAATENKDAMESMLRDHYPNLTSADCKDIQSHVDAIKSVGLKAKLEESLVLAFSVAAKKLPTARSAFDDAVIRQLQGELITQSAKLDVVIANGEPDMKARAAVVAEKQKDHEDAGKRMAASRHARLEFDIVKEELSAQVHDANVAERNAAKDLLLAQQQAIRTEKQLEEFRLGPRGSLDVLLRRRGVQHTASWCSPRTATPEFVHDSCASAGAPIQCA